MNWNALYEENGSGAANYTHAHEPGGGRGARLALVFGQATGVPFYAYHDHLGSVRRWRWYNKTSAAAAEFDPYGGVHAWSGAALPRIFALHEHDPALGFHLAPHRAYAPAMARWTTRDPLGMVDGPNTYAYVRANPIAKFDPLGLRLYWPGHPADPYYDWPSPPPYKCCIKWEPAWKYMGYSSARDCAQGIMGDANSPIFEGLICVGLIGCFYRPATPTIGIGFGVGAAVQYALAYALCILPICTEYKS